MWWCALWRYVSDAARCLKARQRGDLLSFFFNALSRHHTLYRIKLNQNISWKHFTRVAIYSKRTHYFQLLLEYNASPVVTFSNGRVCAVDFLLSTAIDGGTCFDLIKLLLLHGCDIDYNPRTCRRMAMSPMFACIFFLKPMAVLLMLYEFGCQRWDFNWRDNRLYDRREDNETFKAFVSQKAGVY